MLLGVLRRNAHQTEISNVALLIVPIVHWGKLLIFNIIKKNDFSALIIACLLHKCRCSGRQCGCWQKFLGRPDCEVSKSQFAGEHTRESLVDVLPRHGT